MSYTGTDSFSAAWVGIGGQFDESLIQAGTEHDSVGGVANYSCWYELLPQDSVNIDAVTVRPGDIITVTIRLLDPQTRLWSIELMDKTNGQSFSETVTYNSSMLSAEWIVERPTVNNFEPPLAAFSPVTFTGCSATLGGVPGGIISFSDNRFILFGRTNNELASASAQSGDGSSFTVTYLTSR